MRTETEFGTVEYSADMEGVTIDATGAQLWSWSRRPGAYWPCSELGRMDGIRVVFDHSGLVDIEARGMSDADLTSDELNAWSSDVLRDVLSPDHPAWFVSVGQFDSAPS